MGAPEQAEEEEDDADGGSYVTADGAIDWAKVDAAIRVLRDSQRWTEIRPKIAEVRESLPEELRAEFESNR